MTRSLAILAALALALLLAAAAPAGAAEPKASLPDIEDEVMCMECGTALNVSESQVAEDERTFIRQEIAKGRTKEQIKQALVDRYGPNVLALPKSEGFNFAAYAVPIALVLLALAGVALAARRWSRVRAPTPAAASPDLDPADARRLDADLAAFDR